MTSGWLVGPRDPPATWEPPATVVAVLLGAVEVGTDCSIYDPMMSNP